MNIYARIRKIENDLEFKRLINSILGAEHGEDFQATKDWHDFGIDGYNETSKTVYAVYCPRYPERRELQQYKSKVRQDMDKLEQALKDKKIAIEVKAWTFVTPDDLPVEIINFILEETAKKSWKGGALTAMVLAPLFSKYPVIQIDFPSITAGLQFDKTPSVDVNIALNDGYHVLELFNDGTEDIKSIRVAKKVGKEGWVPLTHNFLFEHDNFAMNGGHSLYNLKKGERQYCRSIPTQQPFQYSVSGVGVESSKTLVKEGCIDPLSLEK